MENSIDFNKRACSLIRHLRVGNLFPLFQNSHQIGYAQENLDFKILVIVENPATLNETELLKITETNA